MLGVTIIRSSRFYSTGVPERLFTQHCVSSTPSDVKQSRRQPVSRDIILSLHFHDYYPPTPSHSAKQIRITVVAADGLAKRDVFRLPDPFAMITVDTEQTHRTRTVKKTLNPHWNENFDVTVKDSSIITIQVFDQRIFRRRDQGFLGVVHIRVSDINIFDLELGDPEMLTLELKKSYDSRPVHGKLSVYISPYSSSHIINLSTTHAPDTANQLSGLVLHPCPLQPNFSSIEDNLTPLPPGWECQDRLRRTHYVDHNTRSTTWSRPSHDVEAQSNETRQEADGARDRYPHRISTDDLLEAASTGALDAGSGAKAAPQVVGATAPNTAGIEQLPSGWEDRHVYGPSCYGAHDPRTTTWG